MITLPPQVKQALKTLNSGGFRAYVVGGSVRDILMNRPTRGWDFATDATPEQILSLFPDSFYDNVFGTVGIKIRNPEHDAVVDIYEITPFRSETGYKDFRHPDRVVWGKTIEEDLARRDFTINAIAYDGTTLVDPYKGQEDIKTKIIRAVGNPADRFSEDALRLLRAIRIASQLGFTIEEKTRGAINETSKLLEHISKERIRDEFLKILVSPYASDGVLLLKNTGLLMHSIPELLPAFETEQKSPKRHHMYDVGTHSLKAMEACPTSDPIVKFATLLHDVGKPKTFRKDEKGIITFYNHEVAGTVISRRIVERLRFSKKDSTRILTLIRWHQFSVDERQTDSAIRRIIRRVGLENLADMLALRTGDRLGGGALETSWRLELFKKRLEEVQKQPFSIRDLKVNGYDVMTIFGCRPGPVVGTVLSELFAKVEKGILPNQRELLLEEILNIKNSLRVLSSSQGKKN